MHLSTSQEHVYNCRPTQDIEPKALSITELPAYVVTYSGDRLRWATRTSHAVHPQLAPYVLTVSDGPWDDI